MLISVAMPTYKRLPQLKRAVEDVFAQTWKDWELVISDDEEGEDGETWRWLVDLASRESRVKVLKNRRGKHGQIYNVNSACLATSGEWIKPFFDDDRMLPECLSEFARLAQSRLARDCNVVMIGCRGEKWRTGVKDGEDADFLAHEVEVVPAKDTLRAMCLFDRWNGRTPTHVMMRGDVVRGGATMVEDTFVKHPLDVRWFGRVLEHGALMMTNKVLVCECQGEVESGTSQLWKEEGLVTEENRKVYLEIYDRAVKDSRWPTRLAVDSQICGIRGLYHISKRQLFQGIKYLLLSARSPKGMLLAIRAVRRLRNPGTQPATERIF